MGTPSPAACCDSTSFAVGQSRAWTAAPPVGSGGYRRCHRRRSMLQNLAVRAGDLPAVWWQPQQCLKLLFIDRSDTVRARFALGMLERISAYNGCSRSLAGMPCGMDATAGTRPDLGTQAGLFGLAANWQLRPHLFTGIRMRFETDDIDRFDLLVCLDSNTQAAVLQAVSLDRSSEPASYVQRICCLQDFLMYCSDEALLRTGSASLLDRQLSNQVALVLPALRPSAARVAAAAAGSATTSNSSSGEGEVSVPAYMLPTGIPRPPLGGVCDSSGSTDEKWERMAMLLAVCTAGLVRYLLDCGQEEPASGYSTDE